MDTTARDLRAALEALLDLGDERDASALRAAMTGALPALRTLAEQMDLQPARSVGAEGVWTAPRLGSLAKRMPIGLIVTDHRGRCTYVNERWCALAGIPADAALGTGWHAAVRPADRARVVSQWESSARSGEPFQADFRMGTTDHRSVWVHADGTRLDGEDPESPLVGSLVDISERVRAEIVHEGCTTVLQELATGASLERVLDTLARCAEEGMPGLLCSILLIDEEGRLRHAAAPSLPESYNRAVDGLRPGPGVGSCGTAAHTGARVVVEDITTHPYWASYQDLARLADVGSCWSEPIRSSRGEVLGTLAMYYRQPAAPTAHELEVTRTAAHVAGIAIERKRGETERRRLQAQLRQVVDLVPHMIFAKDADGRFLLVNQAVADAYGSTVEELIGKPHADVHQDPDEVRQMLANDRAVMESGEPGLSPLVNFVDASGRHRILQTIKIPYVTSGEKRPAVLGVAVDISELKRAQHELEQANQALESRVAERTAELSAAYRDLEQEMAERKRAEERARTREEELARVMRLQTLGELAGGLAHEINQPLAAITNYASGCVRRMRPGEPITEELVDAIQRIAHQAQRAGRIVHRHRAFAAKRPSVHEVTDLGELAEGIVEFLASEARRGDVELRLVRPDGPLPAVVDAVQIEQVLVNLVRNSIEAMRDGAPPREVLVRLSALEGERPRVEIAVEDTGPGIPSGVRDRLFQPFFTTKPDAIGMGLTICESIVQAHGSSLKVDEAPERGAVFRFSLPRR